MRGTPNDFFQLKTISISKDWIRKICCKLLALNLQVKPSPSFVIGDHLCFVGLKNTNVFNIWIAVQKLPVKTLFFEDQHYFARAKKQLIGLVRKEGFLF